jgi:outer membrane protein assembly factor BamB
LTGAVVDCGVLIDLDAPAPEAIRKPPTVFWKPLLLAVLLLLLGGAVPPPPARVPAEVAGSGAGAVTASLLTGTALYALLLPSEGQERTRVKAFPLRPGGPAWTTDVPVGQATLSLAADGSTLIVDPGGPMWGELTLLDARTGRERWHGPAFAVDTLVAGDRVAIAPGEDDLGELIVADLLTGRTVWSAIADVFAMYAAGGYLITLDFDGVATVRAVADGRVLVRDRPLRPEEAWQADAVTVLGDRLYVLGPSSVTAYRADDLARLWRAPVRLPTSARACGTAICVVGRDGLTALETGTGVVRWSGPGWRTIDADGFVTREGALVAQVDLATGRVVRDLGRAVVAGDLLLRTDRDNTWVIRLRDGRVVGRLPFFALADCARTRPYLSCPTGAREVTVWRVDER